MGPVKLERLPKTAIAVTIFGLAVILGFCWRDSSWGWWAAAVWLGFPLGDWLLLEALPRTRRSFGPIVPPLLGLLVVRSMLALLLLNIGSVWVMVVAMGSLSLLAWYGTWVEPMSIEVTRRSVAFPQWSAGTKPLRLLQIGDLHLERQGRREDTLNALVEELVPDLICFTGDLLNLSYNSDPVAMRHARAVMGMWQAPLGVYAVSGSPLVDSPETAAAILGELPNIRWLRDEMTSIEDQGRRLCLVGLDCTHSPAVDGARLVEVLQRRPTGTPAVLVYHTPDLAPEAAASGIDLHLAGHTHGGQIRLPLVGALITSSIYYKRFEMGEYELERPDGLTMKLYTSRGIGMEGGAAPRARFLCRPEVVLWTLSGQHDPDHGAVKGISDEPHAPAS